MPSKKPHHRCAALAVPLPDKSGRYKNNFLYLPGFAGEGDHTNAEREMWWWGVLLSSSDIAV